MKYTVVSPELDQEIASVEHLNGGPQATARWEIKTASGKSWSIEGATVSIDSGKVEIVLPDGRRHRYPVTWDRKDGSVIVATPLGSVRLLARRATGAAGPGTKGAKQLVRSSMPGKILRVLCKPGQAVEANEPLLVMEAMKMENEIRSPRAGVVGEISVREGQNVETGALLLRFAEEQA